jgi:hypothetical protein
MCSYLNRDYIDYAPIRNSSSLNSSDGCLDSIHYRPQAAMDSLPSVPASRSSHPSF